ncbi:hypothetical protein [Chelatococcus daeguensis]|uniref:hypothetical protein n=1 Tax=Chelatococcus daeguensis TaxID=444444 RepID=UPI001AECCBE7|nr:hypothetical protein [Chelatococcus daeguensis]
MAGATANLAEGRGGFVDQFQASRAATIEGAEDIRTARFVSDQMVPTTDDDLKNRAAHRLQKRKSGDSSVWSSADEQQSIRAARQLKEVDESAKEFAKGQGLGGAWRAERNYQETVGNVINNRKLDAPLTVVAESMGKGSPEEMKARYKTAVDLVNHGVLKVVKDDSGVRP